MVEDVVTAALERGRMRDPKNKHRNKAVTGTYAQKQHATRNTTKALPPNATLWHPRTNQEDLRVARQWHLHGHAAPAPWTVTAPCNSPMYTRHPCTE